MTRAGVSYIAGVSFMLAAWIGAELLFSGSNIIIPICLIPAVVFISLMELYDIKKEAKKE